MVAKMLSLSESWGWSTEGVQTWSTAMGAVLERPVCERVLGTTSSSWRARWARRDEGWEDWRASSRPWERSAFDLTGAAGEVFLGSFEGGDMESSTLVRRLGHVLECLAETRLGSCGRVRGRACGQRAWSWAAGSERLWARRRTRTGSRMACKAGGARRRGVQEGGCWELGGCWQRAWPGGVQEVGEAPVGCRRDQERWSAGAQERSGPRRSGAETQRRCQLAGTGGRWRALGAGLLGCWAAGCGRAGWLAGAALGKRATMTYRPQHARPSVCSSSW